MEKGQRDQTRKSRSVNLLKDSQIREEDPMEAIDKSRAVTAPGENTTSNKSQKTEGGKLRISKSYIRTQRDRCERMDPHFPIPNHRPTAQLTQPDRPSCELFIFPFSGPSTFPPISPTDPFYLIPSTDFGSFNLIKHPSFAEFAGLGHRLMTTAGFKQTDNQPTPTGGEGAWNQ